MNDTNQSLSQSVSILGQALKELSESKEDHLALKDLTHLIFKSKNGESNFGKGLVWVGDGLNKQFVLAKSNRLFSSENIDLQSGRHYSIAGQNVLELDSLGTSVVKSNLKELGNLKGLIVDGSVSFAQHFYYDAKNKRLGLGTNSPKGTFSLKENNTELVFNINSDGSASIGTQEAKEVQFVTDGKPRISLDASGKITLGNKSLSPIPVDIHGTVSIKTNNPDSSVDLHVNGPVRIHGRLQMYASAPPTNGIYQQGDIIWNENATPGKHVGWICVKSGNPGAWATFGIVSHLG
jgi:hypothetical protein